MGTIMGNMKLDIKGVLTIGQLPHPSLDTPQKKKPKNPSWGPQNMSSRWYGHSKTRGAKILLKQIFFD